MEQKKTTLVLRDYVNCKFLNLDPVTRKKFNEALKFMVPHARHTPQFKLKRWDGKVSFGSIGGSTYINLLELVLPLIIEAGYEIEIDDQRKPADFIFPEIDEDYVADRVWPKGHVMAGEPIMLRDHQVKAINDFFKNQQCLQEISTGAGKTIICAALSMAVEKYGRSIVIVPSKDLVRQTEADYKNLGLNVGVYYGDRKEWQGKQHVISTWQSLAVLKKNEKEFSMEEFLKDVVCVINDEVHTVKGSELRDVLTGPMANVPIRWGLTGTIPKEDYEFISLLSSIGPVIGKIKASELQEIGILANCDIEILQLQENHVEFADWDGESNFLSSDPDRLEWVAQYCSILSETGNTLILVDRRNTGFELEKLIKDSVFLYGDTKSDERSKEYLSIQNSNNKIIIATYGIAAVGINIPRLFNLVLYSCGRSYTRVIQSVGRILRTAKDKNHAHIIDLTSSLKFSKRHLSKRKEYYKEAGYPFVVKKIDYK